MTIKKNKQYQIKTSFLNLFNTFDFSIIKSKSTKVRNLKYFNEIFGLEFSEKKNYFILLEYFQLIKSLKQYLRIIQFYNKKKNKEFCISVESKYLFSFISNSNIKSRTGRS
jgi:hypothetical protein